MAHHIADILRTGTDALNAGDMETFLGLHAGDVVVHVTGRNAYSGTIEGKGAVAALFQKQMELLDGPPQFEVHDVLGSDTHGVLLGVQLVARGGTTLQSKVAIVAHEQDGKLNELWVMSEDPYAEDEFFA